jgi:predicted Zn-dependent peptidase
MPVQYTALQNGIRVLTDTSPHVDSVAMGAFFGVGTRNENMTQNGVAHLVEHMMFKGTRTRSALDIAETIEGIGGHMNAYTSREATAYYFHILKDDVAQTLDVLSDMLQHSIFDATELDRERGVIIQEIGMNNDTPEEVVVDMFQETAYPGQTLGAPILGLAHVIETMPRGAIVDYVRTHYTPKNLVISAAGNIDHDTFVTMVERAFTSLPTDTPHTPVPAQYTGGDTRAVKDLEQAHIFVGFEGLKRRDPRYYDAVALAHILGGGMTSRLFQEIREKRGLVYSTYAFHSAFHDSGTFGVYAGTGEDKIPELMDTLMIEFQKIRDAVSDTEIARTKHQMKSSLLMGRESMTTRADQNAKHLMFHDRVLDTDDLRTRIDAISGDGIITLARQFLATPPTVAALGPIAPLLGYEELKAKLIA